MSPERPNNIKPKPSLLSGISSLYVGRFVPLALKIWLIFLFTSSSKPFCLI